MLNSITSSAVLSSIETRAETNYQDIKLIKKLYNKNWKFFLPNTLKNKDIEN